MDKNNKAALLYRLNQILKYVEEERLDSIKDEIKSIIAEIEHFDMVVPF